MLECGVYVCRLAQTRRQFAFNKQAVIVFFGFDPLADGDIPLVAVKHLGLAVVTQS